MKQAIILSVSLLFASCSTLKHSDNKGEFVKLSVFDITENQFSYVLETFNTSLDTTLLIVPENDFSKLKNVIVKDKTFTFEVVKVKYKVPQMQQLLEVQPPLIVFETDTICKCKNLKFCPVVYLFKALKN